MPKYQVTQSMGTALKNLRIQKNIKAIDVAHAIDKTGAYISKLEKGTLNTIETKDLYKIIEFLSRDNAEVDETLSLLLKSTSLKFSKAESIKEEWILNLDYFYRRIPVPEEYSEYAENKLKELDLSIEQLVTYINSNIDLYNDDNFSTDLLESSEKNHWYFNNGYSYIVVEVEPKDIRDILYNKQTTANYSLFLCILVSLFRLDKMSQDQAYEKATQKLHEYKIFSLSEKADIMNAYDNLEKMHTVLDQRDNERLPAADRKLYTQLYDFTQKCHSFADIHDINYVNNKLSTLLSNLTHDPILFMGFIGIDLSQLQNCDIQIKKDFVKAVQELVTEYSIKEISKFDDLI